MDWLTTLIASPIAWSILALLLAKFLPNDTIDKLGNGLGVIITLGMSKWLPFWDKLEAWLIDGIAVFITGFIKGLRSDN